MATTKKTTKDTHRYVTATDKFLSGWGGAKGKIAKMVIICENSEQARRVARNMEKDRTLSRVSISMKKPSYSKDKYTVTWKYAYDVPLWNK